ncbi:MAG TPA: peptide chain release factor N(5)-glutamine methyltransferase [Chitinophaga sp.]|uniref:peptide chain release factor N(5)-glutamine methyltransferase n=1 Tax=Chitinophaga sp. TaxID=1869181 RepID=UPI002DBA59A5|nr:peptide chain release factor N(5)-glutamine methyltransferase [Chitinophaga sp.]HEU4552551.1 peptide chain release factor N(5)-glutamine methyltransferase [Chitinophaga sp.]
MNIQAAFTYITNTIAPVYEPREAAGIAHLLLEHITGLNKLDRIVYKDKMLEPAQQSQLEQGVAALLQHQPIQYITGTAWFYDMELLVNPEVLIPRPETAGLVEWIVNDAQVKHIKLLDIGTGSGCIPLAVKKALPASEAWGIDVSAGALTIAKANASRQQLDVHFTQVNVLDDAATAALPAFDIIVSNPPYIRQSERIGMQQQVLDYEPALALFVPDEDALLFYRRITQLALRKLQPGGALYFEINEALGPEVVQLVEKAGFANVQLRQDLYGKDRMVKGAYLPNV